MLGVWRNSLTSISRSSRTKSHIWLEHGFNLLLFRTPSRNKAATKPCGLSVCRFATELHRLSCQIYLISSFHEGGGKYITCHRSKLVSTTTTTMYDVPWFVFYKPGVAWQYFQVNLSPKELLIRNRFIFKNIIIIEVVVVVILKAICSP